MNRVLSILMVAVFLAASVGAAPVPDHPVSQSKTKSKTFQSGSKPYQVGRASWYGKRFHGRTTASGEDFNMFELTAAHRQLPLGTYVKVTNLRNGKSVIVRINDRGPYVGGRIMDLSYSAARMLDFRAGVEKVRLDIVETETVASIPNSKD
jgi:rare lipoprotein A